MKLWFSKKTQHISEPKREMENSKKEVPSFRLFYKTDIITNEILHRYSIDSVWIVYG